MSRNLLVFVKFIYSEKATHFWKIFTVDLFYVTVEILQDFVAFSEYVNLSYKDREKEKQSERLL